MSSIVPAAGPDPLSILDKAITSGVGSADLTRLYELVERHRAAQAAEAFARAVTSFQAECPVVKKSRRAEIRGKTEYGYSFASFDDVMAAAAPILARHGIVVTFSFPPAEGPMIRVICRVRVGTHVEETEMTVPVPVMSVNDTQRLGAAVSYAKRYALCAALNIVVSDEDDDAERLVTLASEADIRLIRELIQSKRVDLAKFLTFAGVPDLDSITAAQAPALIQTLRRKPVVATATPSKGDKS